MYQKFIRKIINWHFLVYTGMPNKRFYLKKMNFLIFGQILNTENRTETKTKNNSVCESYPRQSQNTHTFICGTSQF